LIDHDSLFELFYKRFGSDQEAAASAREYLHDNQDAIRPYLEALLTQALEDGNRSNQSLSIMLLGEIPSTISVDILLNALRNEGLDPPAQFLVIRSLAQSDDERVIPILLEIVGGRGNIGWDSAQSGLSRMGEAAIPKIIELFHRGNTYIRRGAVQRLGFYPLHPLTLPVLLEATQDAEALLRYEAVVGLNRFRYPEVLTRLLNLLHDPDGRVRSKVYTSLILIDPYTALTTFMGLLKDQDPTIREEAAVVLVRKPFMYFGLGGWIGQQNLTQFYKDAPEFRGIKGLASSSDIQALLSNTEVIYGTTRVCDIANTALKAIDTPMETALLLRAFIEDRTR